jgi:flavin-dependent dehydrogenase
MGGRLGLIKEEVIVVGGGPGGSSCAARLKDKGFSPLILDKEDFPREKLCGGWITPEVLGDLEFGPENYPHSILTFDTLRVHLRKLHFGLGVVQHSIRRYEFDNWLLARSGARVIKHRVKKVRQQDGGYRVDDQYWCRYLVGAGGTQCPVYRNLFRPMGERPKRFQVAALEREFPYEWSDGNCHLWFFDHGLPGYSWYVPKANGHLNVGIGAVARQLKHRNMDLHQQWQYFLAALHDNALLDGAELKPKGYSYFLRSESPATRLDNAFLVGDAVGLATHDLCEGIGPAVRSGLLAADAIAGMGEYEFHTVGRYSAPNGLVQKALGYMFVGRQ